MSVWNKYPVFSDSELASLVAATAQVLLESQSQTSEVSEEILEASPAAASRELLPLLQETDPAITREQIQQLFEDTDRSRQICLRILGEVRKSPDLAERVAEVYDREVHMMDGGATLLLAGALVVLAMKIKEIDIGEQQSREGIKKGVKITFYEASQGVKSFLATLIKSIGG
jgi:hypothetical protein